MIKVLLKLAEELQITLDENIVDNEQLNYASNLLSDILDEYRGLLDIHNQDEKIKLNYSNQIATLKHSLEAVSKSYKYLISEVTEI